MKMYTEIEMESWRRKSHYHFFMENFLFPHTTVTAPLDVTNLVSFCRENSLSVFHVSVFAISKALNEIKEFRQRARPQGAIEWQRINPSYTILDENKEFLFCDVGFIDALESFVSSSVATADKTKSAGFEEDTHKDDDRIFMSCLPWISFTQISHPVHSSKTDSVPRVAWGKIDERGGSFSMSLNIQAHHAFVDGHHLALAFERIQKVMDSLGS